jgi:hypothetical protein
MYFINKFERTINVTRVLHFSHPSCNSTLTPKKNMQFASNLRNVEEPN